MRRAVIATTSTVAGVVLLLSLKPHHSAGPALAGSGAGSATLPSQGAGTPAPTSSSTASAPTAGSGSKKSSADSGSFVGSTVQTDYGPVQVEITMSDGKLTGVTALQTPSGAARSQEIAAYAVPRLTQEALGAQSAQIDAVSGASYTSAGYIQSLQSALDKARA
ncbi:FMN-binding protein [Streptomyces sp. RB6PN25]|uniref:FMN-binding protein n=1 Tax=Streptomyces humicola TaxID=2953240 RepID=A0ABT1PS18_9ACTN|nr:FMN-binding protein [Streptomyces humicola]MCQ4079928.1 FMN-binding protein [Streptomyces humicola]